MDAIIARLHAEPDEDLMICSADGIAYQRDMAAGRVPYDAAYLEKYDRYEPSDVGVAINAGRCAMLARFARPGASVLDIGACNGAFVRLANRNGYRAQGFDVIPEAVARLRSSELYADDASAADVLTHWDSLEHLEDPALWLRQMRPGAVALVAIPVFEDLWRIRESRHYRPGEHLFYFRPSGFISWMNRHGFAFLGASSHETDAGRDSIGAFAFRKGLAATICECGGDPRLEDYAHPRRATEWFVRCPKCQKRGPSFGCEAEALGHGFAPPFEGGDSERRAA